jgi:hypothetical protein
MRNTLLIIVLSLLIISCNKNTFTTAPQIKLKSVNTNVLLPGQELTITLSVTDKEGDLSSGYVYVEKISQNCDSSHFNDSFPIPQFSATTELQADLLVSFGNGINVQDNTGSSLQSIAFGCDDNDTSIFRFKVKDAAQHISDSVQTGNIVIVKQ